MIQAILNKKGENGWFTFHRFPRVSGAGEESRTLDLNLGKVALYQLSYSRVAAGDYRTTPHRPATRRRTPE